jgi:acetylglutamate kinase
MKKAGKNGEFKLFLENYQSTPKIKFAVIKISGKVLEDDLDTIGEDIAALNKVGIYPTIVHGAGSMLDARLPGSYKIDGKRVTSVLDMEIIAQTFEEISCGLESKIREKGGSARVARDVFSCKPDDPKYGQVGKIVRVDVTEIESALDNCATPIVSPVGRYDGGKLNINADTAATELVRSLQPRKYILLTKTCGVLDQDGNIIPYINVSSENGNGNGYIDGGMALNQTLTALLR